VKAPTLNLGFVNNSRLSELIDKQIGQFDVEARKSTFREVEDILSEEMVSVGGVSGTLTWFLDPSVRNGQMPRDAYNGGVPWLKYWWFA
jgi:ABC-type transport system substrate-binding protein